MTMLWVIGMLVVIAIAGLAGAVHVRVALGSRSEGFLGVFAVGALAVLVLVPAFLARIGHLHRGGALIAGALVVAVSVVMLVRARGQLPGVDVGRLGLVVVVVIVICAPQLLAIAVRTDAVPVGTPWYFWGLAQDYVELAEVPATSEEFGTETSALADYTGFSAGTAVLALGAGGHDGIHAVQVMRAIGVLGTALGFLLLARAWGASLPSAIGGTAVLMSLAYFAGKLSSYRPEGFGYALLFLIPAFLLVFLRAREKSVLVVLGIGVATLSQIHGITFTVAGALVVATLATRLPALLRAHRAELRRLVAPVGVILTGWWGADLVFSGRLTQTGKATSVPRVTETGVDPTLEFMRSVRADPADSFPVTAGELVGNVLRSGTYLHRSVLDVDVFLLVVAVAALAVVMAVISRTPRIGTLLGFAGVAVAIVVAISLAFELGWETYVPRRTGWGRFLAQALLFVPLLGAVALGLGRAARWARVLTVAWLAVGISAYALTAVPIYRIHQSQPTEEQMVALRGLELPEDAVITTNAYSEGFTDAVLHRDALTNGRGPYHQSGLLETAIDQLQAARLFFAAPHPGYLHNRGITHVIAATEPYVFGTTQHYETDLVALETMDELDLVVDAPGFVLYEVLPTRDT